MKDFIINLGKHLVYKVNTCVEKYGTDKFMHMFLFGWIVALFDNFIVKLVLFGIMFILSLLKEKYFDNTADYDDLKAGVFGGIISLIIGIL